MSMKVKVGTAWEDWASSGGAAAKVDVFVNGGTLGVSFTDSIWNVVAPVAAGTSLINAFNGMKKITTVPYFDTSSVTDMQSMFKDCTSLTSIPTLDTSSVTSISSMFYGCTSLTSIPALNTSSVTGMNSAFLGCSSLLEIPALNMSSVTSTSSIFGTSISGRLTSLTRMRAFGSRYGFILQGTKMDATALNEVFQNLGTAVNTSQTIDVKNNPGSAACDPSIATAKGFTVLR